MVSACLLYTSPGSVIGTLPGELAPVEAYLEANLPIAKAMPLVDIVYGLSLIHI